MKRRTLPRCCGGLLGFFLLFPPLAKAQDTSPQSPDVETARVQEMIRQARQEYDQIIRSGGTVNDANNANLKWAATLWQHRGEHPGIPAAALATTEALRLLLRAGHMREMQDKADTLKSDDAAWKQTIGLLMEAGTKQKDFGYVIRKAQTLIERSTDSEIRMHARFTLGEVYWKTGEIEKAKASFQAVVSQYPNTSYAGEAKGDLMEMDLLNPGQSAPPFADKAINGEPIALADFKGRVVLLKFWASLCLQCVGEVPLLKELYAQYRNQGLVIIGISQDKDPKALEDMVKSKGITWPQIRDAQGTLVKLFNVQDTPTYYLIDRDSKIAVKRIPAQKLSGAIAELLGRKKE